MIIASFIEVQILNDLVYRVYLKYLDKLKVRVCHTKMIKIYCEYIFRNKWFWG
jgi:hypothetical protein